MKAKIYDHNASLVNEAIGVDQEILQSVRKEVADILENAITNSGAVEALSKISDKGRTYLRSTLSTLVSTVRDLVEDNRMQRKKVAEMLTGRLPEFLESHSMKKNELPEDEEDYGSLCHSCEIMEECELHPKIGTKGKPTIN